MSQATQRKVYALPTFYASALINDDFSGLEDSDIEQLNYWLAGMRTVFTKRFYCIDAEVEDTYFVHCNIVNHLGCDVCPFTFDTEK